MTWIKIEEQLPPKNTLVWVKRIANKIENEPVYLAMRNGAKMSTNPDASKNCDWNGMHKKYIQIEHDRSDKVSFESSFSDVTVIEWSFVECP